MLSKEKLGQHAVSAGGGAISAGAFMIYIMSMMESEIGHLNEKLKIKLEPITAAVEEFSGKTILPDAVTGIATLKAQLNLMELGHERRFRRLEDFMNRGDRCTSNDCRAIKSDVYKIDEELTNCMVTNATVLYRLEKIEQKHMQEEDK